MSEEHSLSILVINLNETREIQKKKNFSVESFDDLRFRRWDEFFPLSKCQQAHPIFFKNKYHAESRNPFKNIIAFPETRGRCCYPYMDMNIAFRWLSA